MTRERSVQTETDPFASKWRAFAAIAMVYVVIVFSSSMAFLVLPAIAEDFDVTLRAVGWVVIVESLIVSALLLPMGGVADIVGRRRVLLAGMAVLSIGSIFTGLAPNFALLIVARIVMAIGSALAQSIGTGLLVAAFPQSERGLALGGQATAVAIGASAGPLVTGLALDVLRWEALFMLLAIPAALSTAAIWAMIGPDPARGDRASRSEIDGFGSMLAAIAIIALVLTINNPLNLGWSSPVIIGGAAAVIASLVWFVRWELASDHPMLEVRLFTIPVFRWAVIIRTVAFVSATTTSFLLPIYLLSLRGISAGRAGLIISLTTTGMGISAQVSGRLYDRTGPRFPTMLGLCLLVGINAGLAFITATSSLWYLGAIAAVNGIALGLWTVPNSSAMLGAMPAESLGVGGAFTNVTRTVGNVLGQAITAAVVVAVMTSAGFDIPLGEIDENPGAGQSFVDGWRLAYLIASAIAVASLLMASRLPGRAKPTR